MINVVELRKQFAQTQTKRLIELGLSRSQITEYFNKFGPGGIGAAFEICEAWKSCTPNQRMKKVHDVMDQDKFNNVSNEDLHEIWLLARYIEQKMILQKSP